MSKLARITRGSGPGLLLAHGGGGGIQDNYGPILDNLAMRYTVVGPDYPGSGDTPRSREPLTLDGLADELVETAVREGLETFAISGYSMGGPIAIRASIRYPERVTALVLTASFACPNPRIRLATRLWRDLLEGDEDDDRGRLAAFLCLIGLGAPFLDQLSQKQLDETLEAAGSSVPPGTLDHIDLVERIDVRGDLEKVDVPTLVISTSRDALATPFHHRELASGIPGARLAEIDSGHLPFVERPEEWFSLISEFLDNAEPRAARVSRT